ncbi:MAG: mechanosensitive ion channel [Methanomicrobiaceae archaeon]|nr:mechanosensitive ion channel [Methanomicrobiaceae archaeon]
MAEIWLGAIILMAGIFLSFIAYQVYRWLSGRADMTESSVDDIIVLAFGKPLIIAILTVSLYISIAVTDIPEAYGWLKDSRYLVTLFLFLGAWVVSSFTQNFIALYGRWLAAHTESDLDDKIIGILEATAKYIIWFIAFLLALSYLEIDITPLVAGAGIFGLAIALAAQDLISNFFGGALILVDKPFKIGDRVKIDGNLGDVLSIGPRSTRIKTLDYQLLTIPNSKIANSIVTNYAMPDVKLKVKIPVSVAYGSDVRRVKDLLMEIATEAAATEDYVLDDPAPSVYFLEHGESSLNYTMVIWAKAFNMAWDVQDHINFRIDERFREEGIEIPFPQMDIHTR